MEPRSPGQGHAESEVTYIPKPNGKVRPLGIPTVRDRVVQAAVKLIVEPIVEADFEDCSHGFRPGGSAHDALRIIQQHLQGGQTAVYDADLASYFDSIPWDKLMAGVRMRVVNGSVLGLIRQRLSPQQCFTPLPELIGQLNRHLRGWANYFGLGYPRQAFRQLDHFVRCRLGQHLRRRSQRGWRARPGISLYTHLQHLGLVTL